MKKILAIFLFLLWGLFSMNAQTDFVRIASFTQKERTIEVIQMPDGRRIKRFADQRSTANRKWMNRNDEIPFSLFESFEEWDGTQVWLPQNWTWESKEGIGRDNPNYITWFTNTSFWGSESSDGKYSEWINFDVERPQDEWLISPSLVPQASDTLFFDANFTPYWMFYNMENGLIDTDNPVSFLQALISTDNGENWTSLWKATDDYRQYTPVELEEFFSAAEWHEIKLPLNNYTGKTVKIAFRYKGLFGDTNGLDRISVSEKRPFTPKEPAASYAIPPGFFMAGLSPKGEGLQGIMFAPAYHPVTWYNTSYDANNYHWEMPNIYDSGKYISTEENPSARYIQDGYYFPILTVKWDDRTSEPYSWGSGVPDLPYEKAVFFAGGKLDEHIEMEGLGVGNFNLINNIALYSLGEGEHLFGTNPKDSVDGVANFFDRPSQPYILHGVNIATANFKAPAGTQLHLIIHRVIGEALADTVAVATWTADGNIDEPEFYNLSFRLNDLLIEDAVLVELTGFYNKPGVSLACFSEVLHPNAEENNAYLFAFVNNERTLLTPDEILSTANYSSLCFSLEITYSFIGPQNLDYSFITGPGGGSKTFDMATYYPSDTWSVISEIPEWLTVNIIPASDEANVPAIRFAADELPEGFERRYVDVVITDHKGGTCTFEVIQDLFTGIASLPAASRTKAINRGDFYELIYPGDFFDRVNIYAISGQKTASYPLPSGGRFHLPASTMNRGVYLLRLEGKATEILKIVR